MKSDLAVFNGSSINRYGMAFSIEALESALNQSWDLGVPSCISHDLHRPIAWSKGLALHIESGLVRIAGLVYRPENEKESEEIHNALQGFLSKKISENFEPHREKLESMLSGFLSESATPSMLGCAAFHDSGIAIRVFKEIFEQQDKSGLIPLTILNPIAPGVFEKDGLLLFAHPFFRRSLSRFNSLNASFLEVLQSLVGNKDLDVRILLDQDSIGLAETFLEHIELEYWWGPKFDDKLDEIQLGVTKHAASKQQIIFHGISGTEFWWHRQNDILTLECEEIRDIPSLGVGKDSFGWRYVHSMLDPSDSMPNHIDGAIRLYNEESILNRLEIDISRAGRYSEYTKLWRIDGKAELPIWKKLLTHYFRDNHLVGEYLGGQDDTELLRPHTITPSTYCSPLHEYIPCNMDIGQGVRISVSYHTPAQNNNKNCFIIPYDFISHENVEFPYVEADFIEIVKLLNRKNLQIDYPTDILFIAFEDMILNLPLIMHTGENALELASETQKVVTELCDTWVSHEDNREIVYNIGIQYADMDVYFSFAGHVNDMKKWLLSPNSSFPESTDQIGKWCNNASGELIKQFPESKNWPPLYDHLKKSGLLHFERRFLKDDEFRMKYDEKSKSIVADLIIPKKNVALCDNVITGKLQVAYAFLIRDSECSKCNVSYNTCGCSKYIDDGVIQIMKDAPMLGPFWTNRKA